VNLSWTPYLRPERLFRALLLFSWGWLAAQAPPQEALAREPVWRAMLHIPPGSTRSAITDARFFLAPDGARNPRAELEATLARLGDPAVVDRFPGRMEWLAERLGLARPRCEAFEKVWSQLQPRSARFVFADAYMSSPASMFGHTLLVIRGARGADPLQQAVNYAAVTQETNGLLFAYRGIFGKYPGAFSLMPYHRKLQEYTHTEHRDLWEYELELDEPALRRLTLHLWEVKGLGAPYHFFDRNCSFQILHLLQVARPDLDLFGQLPPWVLPLDTLRTVERSGMVRKAHWRPSLTNQVRQMAERMEARQADRALALGRGGPSEGASAPELDLASAWLQAERAQKRIGLEPYQRIQMGLLKARARLGMQAEPDPAPSPAPPHEAHVSQRLRAIWGSDGGRDTVELRWRPALHDWMDPQTGFAPGSGITFGEVGLRFREGDLRPRLGDITLLRVRSFRPMDRFFHPPSWTGGVEWREERLGPEGAPRHAVAADLAAGGTWGGKRASFYVLGLGEARGLPGASTLALGGESGLILDWRDRLRCRAHFRLARRVLGEPGVDRQGGLEARWHLTRNASLGVDWSRKEVLGYSRNDVKASFSCHF